jgi:hypothetical protein
MAMDILGNLLDAGKKMAGEALAKEAQEKSEQGAETLIQLLMNSFQAMTAEQKAELVTLFKSFASQLTDDQPGMQGAWEQLRASPLVKQLAGQTFQQLFKRYGSQLFS